MTLSQGSGARRLAEVRCRAAIQLLLVQASGEVYAAHSQRLPQAAAILMLDALADMAQHARDVDADLDMRRQLAAAQAESKVRLVMPGLLTGTIPPATRHVHFLNAEVKLQRYVAAGHASSPRVPSAEWQLSCACGMFTGA